MTVDTLVAQLDVADIVLSVDGDRLLFDAPAGAMTPDLRASIAEHRAELIRRLSMARPSVATAPAPAFPPDYFAQWIARPDSTGRLGWEAPGVAADSRWWARRTFDQLPQWLPALPMPPAFITQKKDANR